jgi:putative heme-binding domain-containing protein
VRYVGDTLDPADVSHDEITQCLAAPQPLASWSRAVWAPLADRLGRAAIAKAALDETRREEERVRAVEILVVRFGGLLRSELLQLAVAASPRVRARAAWTLRHLAPPADHHAEIAATYLRDDHPLVARAMLESLTGRAGPGSPAINDLLVEKLDAADPYVRQSAARVAAQLPGDEFSAILAAIRQRSRRALLAGLYAASLSGRMNRPAALHVAAETIKSDDLPERIRVDAARIAQLALGDVGGGSGLADVFNGYSGTHSNENWETETAIALAELARAYPTGLDEIDRELARALAVGGLADQELLGRILEKITPESHPVDDIHQLIVAARIPVARSPAGREAIAASLFDVDAKIRRRRLNQDLHWDPRMGELYARLTQLDSQLPAAVAALPDFGRPGSLLFLEQMPEPVRTTAIEKIAERARSDEAYPWSSELVLALADSQSADNMELIRSKADDHRVRGAVLIGLSRRPQASDRSLFVAGLDSASREAVESCLAALAALPASDDPGEQAALLKLVRSLGAEKQDIPLRDAAMRLLARNNGVDFGYQSALQAPQPESIAKWTSWLTERYPEAFKEQRGVGSDATRALAALVGQNAWEQGDSARGEKIFAARSCAQCHQGRGAVGPDLTGVTRRFSRSDVFTAIVDPSRDVSSRYATASIETTSGKTYMGLVVYESVDGVTLRDALNQTIRVEADEIEARRTVKASLMPAGLLDGLDGQELADLYAYLSTL